MIAQFKRTTGSLVAFATAGLLLGSGVPTPVQAADLGGNCCSDLEERVAELEATTVRKGNRKVSLKLSGQVNRAIIWWDDGDEANVYSIDSDETSSRFRVTGMAKIRPGWSAGYKIEIQVESNDGGDVDQNNDDGAKGSGDARVSGRKISWYIKSDQYGRILVGRDSPATDDLILIDLSGTWVVSSAGLFNGLGFFLRDSTIPGRTGQSSTTIGAFFGALDTARADGVRYDSPEILGFTLTAFWGENNFWDAALKFKKEWNGLRVAAGAGYFENQDEEPDVAAAVEEDGNRDRSGYKGSISVWHVPTGLFAKFAFVVNKFDGTDSGDTTTGVITAPGTSRPDTEYYYVKAGWRGRLNSLGHTAIYADYAHRDDVVDGLNFSCPSCVGGDIDEVTSSQAEIWGVGVVQFINNAAMELYLGYRHYEFDVKGFDTGANAIVNAPLENFDMVTGGARIRF